MDEISIQDHEIAAQVQGRNSGISLKAGRNAKAVTCSSMTNIVL
jgi:hypothetical protein